MKKMLLFLLVVLLVFSGILALRFFANGGEDNWICVNNQWVKHGNPKDPKPQTGCGQENKNTPKPDEFSNGQKYKIYKADKFEIRYPDWPNLDPKLILEPEKVKVAVSNEGCNFLINVVSVPANATFKSYTEKLLQEQISKFDIKITTKDIKENNAFIDGEIIMNNTTVRSVSYGYFTSKRESYGIGFIAEKSQFTKACATYVPLVIASVNAQ